MFAGTCPAERRARAERINALLPPGVRPVTADELPDKLDEMLAIYAAPVDAEELAQAQQRVETW